MMNPAALGALLDLDLDNFTVASTPGGIEAQEARGQAEIVASVRLPRTLGRDDDSLPLLSELGFTDIEAFDDLFYSVKLPDGWSFKATDHSMWSMVSNQDDVEVLKVFYKAAFYDRRAFLREA